MSPDPWITIAPCPVASGGPAREPLRQLFPLFERGIVGPGRHGIVGGRGAREDSRLVVLYLRARVEHVVFRSAPPLARLRRVAVIAARGEEAFAEILVRELRALRGTR